MGRVVELFDTPSLFRQNREFRSEGFPSGQREQTVNLPAMPSKVRILPPPPVSSRGVSEQRFGANPERGRAGGPGCSADAEGWRVMVRANGAGSAGLLEKQRGCSSMVEQKPSKLTTRVRFPSPAPKGIGDRGAASTFGQIAVRHIGISC